MFYYYGAKRRLAPLYSPPLHPVIVEPFAGAAGYAMHHLKRGTASHAVLVDRDPRVVQMWQTVLSLSPDELLNYPVPAVGEWTKDPLIITSATSNSWGSVKSMRVTPRMGKVLGGMLRGMAKALPLVQGRVEVHEGDYADARQSGPATYFVDPPYQSQQGDKFYARGKGYASGCAAQNLDFTALAEWCQSLDGQVIVSEHSGAEWLPFTQLVNIGNSQGAKRDEVVWERPIR